ncbi:MAG: glycoside hydrolase family 127 protein [Clostridia bacterium]|nr:glycoside hydrolase family 127 protein [Clostridia bacterium]
MKPLFFLHESEHAVKLSGLGPDTAKKACFAGDVQQMLQFITDTQLTDSVLWKRFVEQYRIKADEKGGWRCEYWGKMMRGGVFVYQCTHDEGLYTALLDAVKDMLTVAEEDGRVSTYSREKEFFDWDVWGRKYVALGMLYFRDICKDRTLRADILKFVRAHIDYIMAHIGDEPAKLPIIKASAAWGGLNASSILEPVMMLYGITGSGKYFDFATHIVGEGGSAWGNILALAEENKLAPHEYPVTKAYEMISFFEGVLEYYFATGKEQYRRAVENFAARVFEGEITVIGCAGLTHELFDYSGARQASNFYKGIKQETCVTVTWMKFCLRMLLLTGDSRYADCFEQSLYNSYRGALNTDQNVLVDRVPRGFLKYGDYVPTYLAFDSYADLLHSTRGRSVGGTQHMQDGTYYGCCACIGALGAGLVSSVGLVRMPGGLVLNLYGDAVYQTVTPEGRAVTFTVTGNYPRGGEVKIAVSMPVGERFALALRVPAWSVNTAICYNGMSKSVTPGYTVLSEAFADGDEILLSLDMRTEVLRPQPWGKAEIYLASSKGGQREVVSEAPEEKYHVALRRGPLVLAREARIVGNSFAPVSVAVDENGYTAATLLARDAVPFDALTALSVPLSDGTSMTVCDFSSVGKTWNEDSAYEVWIPSVD